MMDRVLFGDNQFFGVNHMSEEKARAQAIRFQDLHAILAVLDAAYSEGIRTFMCTTHERVREICDHFRAHADRYPDYTRAVDLSKSPAVVLHGPEADQFRDYLARRRSQAKSIRVGPHDVFWELEPAILEEIRRTHGVPPAG
jgi:hypothetical protein